MSPFHISSGTSSQFFLYLMAEEWKMCVKAVAGLKLLLCKPLSTSQFKGTGDRHVFFFILFRRVFTPDLLKRFERIQPNNPVKGRIICNGFTGFLSLDFYRNGSVIVMHFTSNHIISQNQKKITSLI